MDFNQSVRERIRVNKEKNNGRGKSLLFPESYDIRTLEAVSKIEREGFTESIVLLGDEEKINKDLKDNNISLKDVNIINNKRDNIDEYAGIFYEMRKHKGITFEDAKKCYNN